MTSIIFNQQDFRESLWSGGSTTQLYIFPEDVSYAERNFLFRISTAKVEVHESIFTSLPGFERKLMILEGEIAITHENHYSKTLKPFDVDTFSGAWNTSAVGTCVDFNVMTVGTIQSELTSVELATKEVLLISENEDWSMIFLYPVDESVTITIDHETTQLEKQHLFCAKELGNETIALRRAQWPRLKSENASRIVLVRIKL
jgi:uncharacterized protein